MTPNKLMQTSSHPNSQQKMYKVKMMHIWNGAKVKSTKRKKHTKLFACVPKNCVSVCVVSFFRFDCARRILTRTQTIELHRKMSTYTFCRSAFARWRILEANWSYSHFVYLKYLTKNYAMRNETKYFLLVDQRHFRLSHFRLPSWHSLTLCFW